MRMDCVVLRQVGFSSRANFQRKLFKEPLIKLKGASPGTSLSHLQLLKSCRSSTAQRNSPDYVYSMLRELTNSAPEKINERVNVLRLLSADRYRQFWQKADVFPWCH